MYIGKSKHKILSLRHSNIRGWGDGKVTSQEGKEPREKGPWKPRDSSISKRSDRLY